VCRASAAVAFPARFMLVAAMNACRCGADGSPGACSCTEAARARYAGRISGPLLDRFDLRIRVHRPDVEDLLRNGPRRSSSDSAGTSSEVAARVSNARRRAQGRGVTVNAELPAGQLDEVAALTLGARRLLERKLREGRLSARGLDRVRRVALTVSDLAGHDGPLSEEDVLLALALRVPGVLGAEGAQGAFRAGTATSSPSPSPFALVRP
jgi:magnesium chelatase family protein